MDHECETRSTDLKQSQVSGSGIAIERWVCDMLRFWFVPTSKLPIANWRCEDDVEFRINTSLLVEVTERETREKERGRTKPRVSTWYRCLTPGRPFYISRTPPDMQIDTTETTFCCFAFRSIQIQNHKLVLGWLKIIKVGCQRYITLLCSMYILFCRYIQDPGDRRGKCGSGQLFPQPASVITGSSLLVPFSVYQVSFIRVLNDYFQPASIRR